MPKMQGDVLGEGPRWSYDTSASSTLPLFKIRGTYKVQGNDTLEDIMQIDPVKAC